MTAKGEKAKVGGKARVGGLGLGVGVVTANEGGSGDFKSVRARLEPLQDQARGRSSPPLRTPDLQHQQHQPSVSCQPAR